MKKAIGLCPMANLSFFSSATELLADRVGVNNNGGVSGVAQLYGIAISVSSGSSSFVTTRCERDSCDSYEHKN